MQEFGEVGLGWQGEWRNQIVDVDEAAKAQLMLLADLEQYSEAYCQAVTNRTVVGAVADLLESAVEFVYSILHAKAPNLGTRWRRLIRVGYRDPSNEWKRGNDESWTGLRHTGNQSRIGRTNGVILRGQRHKSRPE